MEKILEGMNGMPKNGKVGLGGAGPGAGAVSASSSGEDGGSEGGGGEGGGSGDGRKDAARVLSTLSGAAFAADGVGREIAGLFTETSDGIFF